MERNRMIKVNEKIIKQLFHEGGFFGLNYELANPDPNYEVIEVSEWQDEGKYSIRTLVFKHQDKYWEALEDRSGSYYTDYDFSYREECYEVILVEKVIKVWEQIKEEEIIPVAKSKKPKIW